MKAILKTSLVLWVLLTLSSCEKESSAATQTASNQVMEHLKSATDLTSDFDGIRFMREEEKLAHDVYQELNKDWNMRIFVNIMQSESRHMEAMKGLLDYYNLEDPAHSQTGIFTNQNLQNLYNTLMIKGIKSRKDALEVGEIIEVTDIRDIENLISQTSEERIISVYSNLLKGSKNHLRAFRNQLNK